ncbi:hypothetical protein CLV35_2211 [Motilibacter peucedani]|uniref:Uncharacterized protein n=1 Tax=Motilibacter peucedani TaxID=598650 RepID=A0A420XR83_9ACTN|nr:hypothetical protein CLV35_2211 [Motilibacter peucedani]
MATVQPPVAPVAGQRVNVRVRLRSRDGRRVSVLTGGATVLLVKDGFVVGRDHGDVGHTSEGWGPTLEGSDEATTESSVALRGCPFGPVGRRHPDLTRDALRAGTYGLVAVLYDNDGSRITGPATKLRLP